MANILKDVLSEGDHETLRALLYACAATEAEDMDHWRSMCPRQDSCPLAPAVKADARERDRLIESFSDAEVVKYLSLYFDCYENAGLENYR